MKSKEYFWVCFVRSLRIFPVVSLVLLFVWKWSPFDFFLKSLFSKPDIKICFLCKQWFVTLYYYNEFNANIVFSHLWIFVELVLENCYSRTFGPRIVLQIESLVPDNFKLSEYLHGLVKVSSLFSLVSAFSVWRGWNCIAWFDDIFAIMVKLVDWTKSCEHWEENDCFRT